jgi:hypothetical protein
LNQGWSTKDLEGVIEFEQWHHYREDQERKENYKQVQPFCTKEPRKYTRNAIGSNSNTTTYGSHDGAKHNATGNMATWGEVSGANYTNGKRAPNRHRSLEV